MEATDAVLLTKWLSAGDAEAFLFISKRYSGMVYSTCRRILRNPVDAEDVAQECFETLCSTRNVPRDYLGPWLHRVATNRCLTRLKSEERRKRRETEHAKQPETQAEWDDVYEFVDEAIAALPDKYRAPVMAHFFEGMTHAEVAELLGVSRQTVTYRLAKAIEKIRSVLKRRGVLVAADALTAMLAMHLKAEATPASLAGSLAKLALAGRATGGAVTGASFVWLTKPIIGAALVLGAMVIGASVLWSSHLSKHDTIALSRTARADSKPSDQISKTDGAAPAHPSLSSSSSPSLDEPAAAKPDSGGDYSFEGLIYTDKGQVVPGAEVTVIATGFDKEPKGGSDTDDFAPVFVGWQQRPRYWRGTANTSGRYAFHGVDCGGYAALVATAPGYGGHLQVELKPGEPRKHVDVRVSERQAVLTGRVLNPEGEPVPEALVEIVAGRFESNSGGGMFSGQRWMFACTNEQGMFQMGMARRPGEKVTVALMAVAAGYPPASFDAVLVGETTDVVDLKFQRAAHVSGRIAWPNGEPCPVSKVELTASASVGGKYGGGINAQLYQTAVGEDGAFQFDAVAPANHYQIGVCATPPYCEKEDLGSLAPGEQRIWNHEIGKAIVIRGHVFTDNQKAAAGAEVYVWKGSELDSHHFIAGPDGAYTVSVPAPGLYRLTAGYASDDIGREIQHDVDCVSGGIYEIDLKVPAPCIVPLLVEDEAGPPTVPDASIDLAKQQGEGGSFSTSDFGTTGADGRFVLRTCSLHEQWFQVHKEGFAKNRTQNFKAISGEQLPEQTVVLYPEGGLEGVAVDAQGAPLANASLLLYIKCPRCGPNVFSVVSTDATGAFVFSDAIPSEEISVEIHALLETGNPQDLTASLDGVRCTPHMITDLGRITFVEKPDDRH